MQRICVKISSRRFPCVFFCCLNLKKQLELLLKICQTLFDLEHFKFLLEFNFTKVPKLSTLYMMRKLD